MANIIAGKEIVPEFIQFKAKPRMIANSMLNFLQDPSSSIRLSQDLLKVKNDLGEPGAAQRAARLILNFLQK